MSGSFLETRLVFVHEKIDKIPKANNAILFIIVLGLKLFY